MIASPPRPSTIDRLIFDESVLYQRPTIYNFHPLSNPLSLWGIASDDSGSKRRGSETYFVFSSVLLLEGPHQDSILKVLLW